MIVKASREIVCPRKIGPYILMDSIGRGSFSDVKAAVDTRTGQQFACKVISKRRLLEAKLNESFQREIDVLSQVHHPAIINMHDYLSDSLNHYVILELFSRRNLCDRIVKEGPLCGDELLSVFVQIADAVKCLHDRDLAHRDLKTENILINEAGLVKLIDFGFTRAQDECNPMTTHCGTMAYTAPECFYADNYNGLAADIWSLGVVLYSLVTGAFPWTKSGGPQLMNEIIHGTFFVPGRVPKECADLMYAMMKKNPEERITIDGVLESEFLKGAPRPVNTDVTRGRLAPVVSQPCVHRHSKRIDGKYLLRIAGRVRRKAQDGIGRVSLKPLASFLPVTNEVWSD